MSFYNRAYDTKCKTPVHLGNQESAKLKSYVKQKVAPASKNDTNWISLKKNPMLENAVPCSAFLEIGMRDFIQTQVLEPFPSKLVQNYCISIN